MHIHLLPSSIAPALGSTVKHSSNESSVSRVLHFGQAVSSSAIRFMLIAFGTRASAVEHDLQMALYLRVIRPCSSAFSRCCFTVASARPVLFVMLTRVGSFACRVRIMVLRKSRSSSRGRIANCSAVIGGVEFGFFSRSSTFLWI